MSAFVGTELSGRYRLDAQIGAGGMSTVYRAFDTVLEREVAVKLMHRDIAHNPDQLERFRREARSVAQLNHPHIVQVIDAGEESDPHSPTPTALPYIVFEYVEGQTLKERIRHFGRLEIPEAVAYAIEIARGLGAAHERGIVHRDVKPQNIMVDEEGSAKITDFGIARTLEQEGLTADGRVLGTTDYVSPEQALGHAVTGQSDLYSLGVVLYEMLVGDVPFHGETQVAVAMKHVREELPDVQWRRPEVSSALASLLDRATAKDLAERYQTDRELITDLEQVLAIEIARSSGQVTGEATTVLRTLPSDQRRRLPFRSRVSMPALVALVALAGTVFALVLVLAADRAERGTGQGRDRPTPTTTQPAGGRPVAVNLKQDAASDYDPLGGDGEHGEETAAAVDRVPSTTWSTETYQDGLGKAGVGLTIDAAPGVAATVMNVRSPTPGFVATIYGAKRGVPETLPDERWVQLAPSRSYGRDDDVELDTGGERYSTYLVWITALPESGDKAELSEISLFRDQNR